MSQISFLVMDGLIDWMWFKDTRPKLKVAYPSASIRLRLHHSIAIISH